MVSIVAVGVAVVGILHVFENSLDDAPFWDVSDPV